MATTKATVKDAVTEQQLFGQVSESIQTIVDLTSRIDERVKMLSERHKEIEDQIEKLIVRQDNIFHRLATIEANDLISLRESLISLSETVAIIVESKKDLVELRSKVQGLEIKFESTQMRIGHHDHRWSQIFDAIWKTTLMCIAGYILYKLGLQAPPN